VIVLAVTSRLFWGNPGPFELYRASCGCNEQAVLVANWVVQAISIGAIGAVEQGKLLGPASIAASCCGCVKQGKPCIEQVVWLQIGWCKPS
jgi:hypothetical protein